MSNYTPVTNFVAKDALTSGNPLKAVTGTAIGNEFAAVQTAINSKADSSSVPTATSGTFTGTLTGMGSVTTGTVNYELVGKICFLTVLASITGTSSSTSMTLTGLPAACQPTSGTPWNSIPAFLDNGGSSSGTAQVFAGGIINFGLLNVGGSRAGPAGSFTASGVKGLPAGFTMAYPLD